MQRIAEIKVADRHAGRSGKCPRCHEAFVVPQTFEENLEIPSSENSEKRFEKQENNQPPETDSGLPLWLKYSFGIAALLLISLLLWAFVLRDTWEIDHYSELSNLISQSENFYNSKDYEEGIENYNNGFL